MAYNYLAYTDLLPFIGFQHSRLRLDLHWPTYTTLKYNCKLNILFSFPILLLYSACFKSEKQRFCLFVMLQRNKTVTKLDNCTLSGSSIYVRPGTSLSFAQELCHRFYIKNLKKGPETLASRIWIHIYCLFTKEKNPFTLIRLYEEQILIIQYIFNIIQII